MKKILSLMIVWVGMASVSESADIVALCIGNDAYVNANDVLDTPVSDATLMKTTLEALPGGADVRLLTDASREDIVIALNSLAQRANRAKLVLVYYSGHGLEGQPEGYAKADTFLLPVEATIPDVNYLPTRAVGLQTVLEALGKCPVTARAVILDCCRTGAPKATAALKGSTKSFGDIDQSVKDALGAAVVPEATLVAFAASPGRKAAAFLKQSDTNSPFTLFLADALAKGSGNLRDLVETAAERTEEATGRRQVPFVSYTGAAGAIRQIVWREKPAASEDESRLAAMARELEEAKRKLAEAEAMKKQPSTLDPRPSTTPTMVRTEPAPSGAFAAGDGMEGSRAGEVKSFGGIEFVWCPPGEFLMGSPEDEQWRSDDETQHRVTLTKGFWLARTECTQAQWEGVMGSNPSDFKGADLPVEQVSWDDVQGWLRKMNDKNPLPPGWKWDLPSEAQWEYACRAGTETVFSFGNVLDGTQANCDGNHPYGTTASGPYLGKTRDVGGYPANGWGLHDMHGNVWEWCADWYGDYPSGSSTEPAGATTGSDRVNRGGGWFGGARSCRSADRYGLTPEDRDGRLGFRPALSSLPAR